MMLVHYHGETIIVMNYPNFTAGHMKGYCILLYIYICIYVCTYICTYTYIHIYMYVYECMNICLHRMCNIINNKNVVYAVKRTNWQPTNW